ncbi:bifunctional adenosylcobinamide kinase/adenosylcobinamide-phosphate guanylyltransferase [Cytobacillus sp. FJAT-53684]|uniref:Bifunctional adenosylcobinamide kinase/adenosylcobinamide-phosphate guanylyltransferase n=1 Tax=Cytobacillus mangrovibacter TaxID=3299024 RepID=A0ABW6K3U2_9BACI
MHFVTGGAFNGKSRWVKEYYELNETPYLWISAYKGDSVPEHTDNWMDVMILEGLEKWVQEWSSQLDSHEIREKWRRLLCSWLKWEKEAGHRKLILIGTDLSKGIVPMRAEERKWRDITGWTYQDVAGMAEKVDLIWYGISQKIK